MIAANNQRMNEYRTISTWAATLTNLWLTVSVAAAGCGPRFNAKGNWLIADQYNNRVIELDPTTHTIVWEYAVSIHKAETNWLVGAVDAERVKSRTLIVAAGVPGGG